LGMSPAFSLQTALVIFLMLLFRVQIGAALISSFFFKFMAWTLDPVFDVVGAGILELDSLNGIFTTLYNMPIIPLTRFNNSIVMGSGIVAIALSPFLFILARFLIVKYREKVVAKIKETKFWKVLQSTSLFKWYYKYDNLYN